MAFAQSFKCAACRSQLHPNSQIDHVIPWSVSADNSWSNLQILCPNCHASKTATEAMKIREVKRLFVTNTAGPIHEERSVCWSCIKTIVRKTTPHSHTTESTIPDPPLPSARQILRSQEPPRPWSTISDPQAPRGLQAQPVSGPPRQLLVHSSVQEPLPAQPKAKCPAKVSPPMRFGSVVQKPHHEQTAFAGLGCERHITSLSCTLVGPDISEEIWRNFLTAECTHWFVRKRLEPLLDLRVYTAYLRLKRYRRSAKCVIDTIRERLLEDSIDMTQFDKVLRNNATALYKRWAKSTEAQEWVIVSDEPPRVGRPPRNRHSSDEERDLANKSRPTDGGLDESYEMVSEDDELIVADDTAASRSVPASCAAPDTNVAGPPVPCLRTGVADPPSGLLVTSPCSRSTMPSVVPAGALGVRSDGEVNLSGESVVGGSGARKRRLPTTRRGREEDAQSRREKRLRLLRETSFDYKHGRVTTCRAYCFSTTYDKVPAREHWEAFVKSLPIVNFAFRRNRDSGLVHGYFRLLYNIPVSSVPKRIASGLGIDSYVCGLTLYPLPDQDIGLSKYTNIAVDEPELAEWIYASKPPRLSGQR
jgi:hypothetical protein